MIPRATYRLQFHAGFTFADAEALLPYLSGLGISHVYASPVTTARRGSVHGYDVVDPTRINPELGGEEAFRTFVAALRRHEMGIIVDIVPNHMGVVGGENLWWQDVLQKGQKSCYAKFFDIDWREKLLLPVLGESFSTAIESGSLSLEKKGDDFYISAYGVHRFPVRTEDYLLAADYDRGAEDHHVRLRLLLERQHYRLSWWRTANDELNWRRFFTITELAGLRVEDEEVFEQTHALYFRLYGEGLIDGLRIDHVDGLADPGAYCRKLRTRIDAIDRNPEAPQGPAYIVVEKILGTGEELSRDWGIDGTSGYDFMEEVSALLHSRDGEGGLTSLWEHLNGGEGGFEPEELKARQEMLAWQFDSQLRRCAESFHALAKSADEGQEITLAMFRRAVERLIWVFPVYRTYGTGSSAPAADVRVRAAVRARVERFIPPGESSVIDMILEWLAGEGSGDRACASEAVQRFQQLSAPIAAKAVEDTAFYRYGRLLSRNDVGFDAARLSATIEDFHAASERRRVAFPHAMLATATHDHKRGEDARARLAVLSEVPDVWRKHITYWLEMNEPLSGGIHIADLYMLYQTLVGSWPMNVSAIGTAELVDLAERVAAWQTKALREARMRSSWEAPNEEYEKDCRRTVEALLDPASSPEFLADITSFVSWIEPAARANSLVQMALRCTVPGVPDLYQGAECPDFSLVDPDNRRPVEFDRRRQLLTEMRELRDPHGGKLALLARLLRLRRDHPSVFADGSYEPVIASGSRAQHVLAFRRRTAEEELLCAVALHCAHPLTGGDALVASARWWEDTSVELHVGKGTGAVRISDLFRDEPVFVAVRRTR